MSLLLSGVSFNPTARVMAENIRIKIDRILGSREDLTSYAQILNTTKTVADVDVTLENVILDEDTLYVLLDVNDKRESVNEDEDQVDIAPSGSICINGKSVDDVMGNRSTEISHSLGEKGTEVLIKYVFDGYTFPEKIEKLKIPFKIIRYITREYEAPDATVLGDVEFTFSASRKELQASSKSVETDIKVKLRNNTEVQVQKVRVSKVASSIFVKCDKKFWGKSKVYRKEKTAKETLYVTVVIWSTIKMPVAFISTVTVKVLTRRKKMNLRRKMLPIAFLYQIRMLIQWNCNFISLMQ